MAAATSSALAASALTYFLRLTSKTAGREFRQTAEWMQTFGSNVTVMPGAV